MSVNYLELMDSVRRVIKLENQDLNFAAPLQRAERDEGPVMQSGANVPLEVGSRRDFMCPDLYRATISGSIDRVTDLLGLIEETSRPIHDGAHATLGDARERNESRGQWGCRLHGHSSCTLQEVTVEMNTVLHVAAEQGHVELVENIIRRDHTLLISENSSHETPLHLAARAGNHNIVSLVVFRAQESGIGAYKVLIKRNKNGDTVLHEAARHGHEDVVRVLMIVAPELSVELNNASMSPLYLAVVTKSIGIVRRLLQYSRSSVVGPNQKNALHAAVLQSQELTSLLLDRKADLANKRDASGSTPIHYAASSGNVTVVKTFLDKAPLVVYIQDQDGSSPLHIAARMLNYSAISTMIDHCPDSFEIRDNHGRNFLHIVAQHGRREINLNHHDLKNIISIINLVSRSPDLKKLVNERDNEGKTVLDHAVSSSNFIFRVCAVATLSAHGATFSPHQQQRNVLKNWKDETTKWIDRTSKNLIVVSTLISTIAFSVAFNVPGSYNDNGVSNLRQTWQYNIFLILDTIAMSASASATVLLVVAKAVSKRGSGICFALSLFFLWISLFTMELAFVIAVSLTLGNGKIVTKSIISCISMSSFIWTIIAIGNDSKNVFLLLPKLAYVRRSNLFIFLNLFFYFTSFVMLLAKIAVLWTVFANY